MEKTKINMRTTKRTYLESLWGGPNGENQTNFGKNKNLGNTKKHILRLLAYPPPSPRLLENCFFLIFLVLPMFFIFFNVFWCFLFFGVSILVSQCSWLFQYFFGFLHGVLPKEIPNMFFWFFSCLFLFSPRGPPQRISKYIFWCFPAYNVVHKKKQQKSNGKTVCVSSGWLESHREGRHLDQTYYVHVCFAGMGKR